MGEVLNTKKGSDGGGGGGDILADGSVPFTGIETFEVGLRVDTISSATGGVPFILFSDGDVTTTLTSPNDATNIKIDGDNDQVIVTAAGGAIFDGQVEAPTLKTADVSIYTSAEFKVGSAETTETFVFNTAAAIPVEINGVTYFLATATIV